MRTLLSRAILAGTLLWSSSVSAQSQLTESPPPRRPGPWLLHLNLGVNAYTYVAANPTRTPAIPQAHFWPGNRLILLQQLGAGYFVHPNISLRTTLQFTEYVQTNQASRQMEGAFAMFGTILWATVHAGPFFAGAGPIFAWYTPRGMDVGLFTALGLSAPVGLGFSVGGAVQVPIMFYQTVQVSVSPAFFVARRF